MPQNPAFHGVPPESARPSPAEPQVAHALALRLAQATCAVLAICILVVFTHATPVYHTYLLERCFDDVCLNGPRLSFGSSELAAAGFSPRLYALALVGLDVLFAFVSILVACLLVLRGSTERMALFGAFALLTFGSVGFTNAPRALAELHPVWEPLVQTLGFGGLMSFTVFFYVFPRGRFTLTWNRYLLPVWAVGFGLLSFAPSSAYGPLHWPPVLTASFFALWLSSLAYVQYRAYRKSTPTQRQQIRWVVCGFCAAAAGFLLFAALPFALFGPPALEPFGALLGLTAIHGSMTLIPLSIGAAAMRRRLWDLEPILNRTLVYSALTLFVIGLYVMVVLGLGGALQAERSAALSLLATALAAVLFQPLRERLQISVNRLMYGERDAPYDVLRKLGDRLEATLDPLDALRVIVETVRESLKVPHVAIRTTGTEAEAGAVVAMSGSPVADTERFPLLHNGAPEGELLVAARSPGEAFARQDLALLEEFARQAGNAVYAARLSADLQRARERLVLAREEERRRLRRDLHDELGPALAVHGLKLGSARLLLSRDPAAAETILAELERGLERTVNDVRRVVHELRPPALDDLGLEGALRELVRRFDGNALRVTLLVPRTLPSLPAAVEAAVYRITQEAVTNVVRHAGARTCEVRLHLDGMLLLEIEDDGAGLPASRSGGVGLRSMRERAEELGGSVAFDTCTSGLRVRARLPLETSASRVSGER